MREAPLPLSDAGVERGTSLEASEAPALARGFIARRDALGINVEATLTVDSCEDDLPTASLLAVSSSIGSHAAHEVEHEMRRETHSGAGHSRRRSDMRRNIVIKPSSRVNIQEANEALAGAFGPPISEVAPPRHRHHDQQRPSGAPESAPDGDGSVSPRTKELTEILAKVQAVGENASEDAAALASSQPPPGGV